MHFSRIFVDVIEPLQNLDFSLVKSFLLRGVLVLEFFDCIILASFDMPAFEDVAERSTTDQLFLLIFVPNYEFVLLRRAIPSNRLCTVGIVADPNHELRSLMSHSNWRRACLLLVHRPDQIVFNVLLNGALSLLK